MQYIHGYKYAIRIMNDNHVLTSEIEGDVTTWTLKDGETYLIKCGELINPHCVALDHIVRYLKNPSFYGIKTTIERNVLTAEIDALTTEEKDLLTKKERADLQPKECFAIYNSDTKAIESWHNETWI